MLLAHVFFVDNMISSGYFFKDRFMDTFVPVSYLLEDCGIRFSVFLFLKLSVAVVVMVIRHLEKTKMTGASLGFGETILSASYTFLMSVLTSFYDLRAPPLAAVEQERKTLCNEEELIDMREDTKEKEEHISAVKGPAKFNQAVTPFSLV